MAERAGRSFYSTTAQTLARRLIGQRLVRVWEGERLSGLIVETEAYIGVEDGASHAFGGRRTRRNEAMYGRAGLAYVYFTYGMHHCLNVVCGDEGDPQAVLVRAVEVDEGMERMRRARGRKELRDHELCRGPGSLCRAMGVDLHLNGVDLTTSEGLWVEVERGRAFGRGVLECGRRVGIGERAGEWVESRLRWWKRGSRAVSRG
jgi:DNA-3-methyladenine glycosylase